MIRRATRWHQSWPADGAAGAWVRVSTKLTEDVPPLAVWVGAGGDVGLANITDVDAGKAHKPDDTLLQHLQAKADRLAVVAIGVGGAKDKGWADGR